MSWVVRFGGKWLLRFRQTCVKKSTPYVVNSGHPVRKMQHKMRIDCFPKPTIEIAVTSRSKSVASAHVDCGVSKCEGALVRAVNTSLPWTVSFNTCPLDINAIYLKEKFFLKDGFSMQRFMRSLVTALRFLCTCSLHVANTVCNVSRSAVACAACLRSVSRCRGSQCCDRPHPISQLLIEFRPCCFNASHGHASSPRCRTSSPSCRCPARRQHCNC